MNIAHEIAFPFASIKEGQQCFAIIDIDREEQIDAILELKDLNVTPVLYKAAAHPSRWHTAYKEQVVGRHAEVAKRLVGGGYDVLAISSHCDGALQQMLSPRFSELSLPDRMRPLMDSFLAIKAIADEVLIFLTVEELAPGGMDATDGVAVAESLGDVGLTKVIATGGTKDFPWLSDRRATKKKHEQQCFSSNEPALAAALWLRENTALHVGCSAFIDDDAEANKLAQALGLFILVKRCPGKVVD